jgi:hypothetical protein
MDRHSDSGSIMENSRAPIIHTATFVFKFDRFYIETDGTPRMVFTMLFEGTESEEHNVAPGEEYTLNFNYGVGRGTLKEPDSDNL